MPTPISPDSSPYSGRQRAKPGCRTTAIGRSQWIAGVLGNRRGAQTAATSASAA